jgi:hypothetical protein
MRENGFVMNTNFHVRMCEEEVFEWEGGLTFCEECGKVVSHCICEDK